MRRIYLASSWRNAEQPALVELLREAGHRVYDFRNPPFGRAGFAWSAIDPDWEKWGPRAYLQALHTDVAMAGYASDLRGMRWADTCVLALPCGRSAHLEAGYFSNGKKLIVYMPQKEEPDLMYLLADAITFDRDELLDALK